MKVVAIVQARMNSTRLPNKVMMDIHGSPMIKWVLKRAQAAQMIDEVVIATTQNNQDDILVSWCKKNGYCFYRGSEEDVLSRFYYCAKENSADLIVRVTADDPLKDPSIMDEIISKLIETESDYCSNTITPSYPEGLDIEVFTIDALEKAFKEAELVSEREHVTPYIWKNTDRFKITQLIFERDLSGWRWTVDKLEDLHFIKLLIGKSEKRYDSTYKDLIAEVEKSPELIDLTTARTIRNEGYLKSLANENNKPE